MAGGRRSGIYPPDRYENAFCSALDYARVMVARRYGGRYARLLLYLCTRVSHISRFSR